ncbi:MAG: hypothetical protein HETSPECPRED_003829 [Heterodermia speciosa]|uniref:Uncharacterized protein n=1 Tax=Heterodermia speciosa TaxID=116794 RepID=A0A8H3F521_9LECA|nr:MAG: hypothetical protein HETSPECPRED_003829 [Heterodermia speciosa]
MPSSDLKPMVISPAPIPKSAIDEEISVQRARWANSLNATIDYWLTLPSTAVNFCLFLNLAQHNVTVPEATKLLRLGGSFITRMFDNGAMTLSVSVESILSHIDWVGEAENFAILLRNNGFEKVGWRDAVALMEQLARFLPMMRALERIPPGLVKEGSTDSKAAKKEGSVVDFL